MVVVYQVVMFGINLKCVRNCLKQVFITAMLKQMKIKTSCYRDYMISLRDKAWVKASKSAEGC